MPALGWIIVACIILVLIYTCVIVGAENEALTTLAESNGTFDQPAKAALTKINKKTRPTAQERVARADILRYNIDNGVIRNEETARSIVDDYAIAAAIAEDIRDIDAAATRLRTFDDAIAFGGAGDLVNLADQHAANALKKSIVAHKDGAVRASGRRGRAAVTRAYYDSVKVVASDSQNVHDSKVSSDLRDTLDRIGEGRPARICIAEARNASDDQRVHKTLDTIEAGHFITTLGRSEDRVFAAVWSRADHPDNVLRRDDIREAIISALADCNESGGLVCINGRCGRVIGSLAAIDADPSVGNVGTSDYYKSTITTESAQIVDRSLEELRKNDPDAAAAWESGDDGNASREFTERVRRDIAAHVDTYRGRLPPAQFDAIRETCMAGI